MKKFNNELTGKEYAQMFQEYISEGKDIYNDKKTEQLILEDEEIFIQCYANTETRRLFPPYWFVSDIGNLVSLSTGEPVWLKQNERDNGSKYYKFGIKDSEGNHVQYKNIEVHNLVALVHGSDIFGQAKELLEKDGIFAFGVNNKAESKVQGHHKDGDHSNNNVKNIQILTSDMHNLLEKAPSPDASDEKIFTYMKELSNQLQIEEPGKPVFTSAGYTVNTKTGEYKDADVYAQVLSFTQEEYLEAMRVVYNSIRSYLESRNKTVSVE